MIQLYHVSSFWSSRPVVLDDPANIAQKADCKDVQTENFEVKHTPQIRDKTFTKYSPVCDEN